MSDYATKSAWRYRARAEEIRTLAELDRSEETRTMLLGVAAEYDRIAHDLETITASTLARDCLRATAQGVRSA